MLLPIWRRSRTKRPGKRSKHSVSSVETWCHTSSKAANLGRFTTWPPQQELIACWNHCWNASSLHGAAKWSHVGKLKRRAHIWTFFKKIFVALPPQAFYLGNHLLNQLWVEKNLPFAPCEVQVDRAMPHRAEMRVRLKSDHEISRASSGLDQPYHMY